jgi:predicted DNA binding protein
MWRLKLKLDSSKQLLGQLAIKHQVSMTGYPLSYWKDGKFIYLMSIGFMFGEEKNKKQVLKEMKKSKEIVDFEISGDLIINVSKQPLFTEPVYNPEIIRPSPVIINKQGFHIWDLASFNRKVLERVLEFAEKRLQGEIISFKEEKIENISFTKLLPDLTKNQKNALEVAINNGYYDYPKKIKMEDLAKKMKISYSTFQAHLKKAEGKIIPSVFKEL